MQRATACAMTSPIGVGDARFHYGGKAGPVDTVYLGVFRRTPCIAAGQFDESLTRNQDYELNIRLRANGGTVWFDPRLEVAYRPRRSLLELWRQYFQYGRWKREVIRMHPESTRLRQLAPPFFVVALLASLALGFTPLRWLGLIVPGVYVAATPPGHDPAVGADARQCCSGVSCCRLHHAYLVGPRLPNRPLGLHRIPARRPRATRIRHE